MQGSRPSVRGFYWRENQLVGNLGDALAPILLDALGYELSPRTRSDTTVLNPGRCLIMIGSLLNDYDLPPLGPSITRRPMVIRSPTSVTSFANRYESARRPCSRHAPLADSLPRGSLALIPDSTPPWRVMGA